jgi:hypothetical protein
MEISMKFIWIAVVSLVFSLASLLPLAFDSSTAERAEREARSQLATKYLYENIAAFR